MDPAGLLPLAKPGVGNNVKSLVARTFGLMTSRRRLVRDYEKRIDVSHAVIIVAMGQSHPQKRPSVNFKTDSYTEYALAPFLLAALTVDRR